MVKKIKLQLVGLDGNAFSLLAAFRRQAKKEKWSDAEINVFTTRAMSGSYDDLLRCLMDVCED